MKKFYVIISTLIIFSLLLSGCGKKAEQPADDASSAAPVVSETEPDKGNLNTLTGIYGTLDDSAVGKRPVAVMINNISTAQPVQTGLNKADVVFECLVEGGISRLMAVFSDLSQCEKLGTIRSARYSYVQLAKSLDAIYVHCGMDDTYTRPYAKEMPNFDFFDLGAQSDSLSMRIKNGLAYEHTLYIKGEAVESAVYDKYRNDISSDLSGKTLFNFAEEAGVPANGNECTSIKYYMSGDNYSTFKYDSQTKKYRRCPFGKSQTDYFTDEAFEFDNVFVLYAPTYDFSDGYHVHTDLDGGEGYYISNGVYKEIKWTKGDASDRLKVYDADGSELSVNPGTSFIAFPEKSLSNRTVIEPAPSQSDVSAYDSSVND